MFTPGSADASGATGSYGALSLWGPNNGSANGLPATSPDGGNFVAMDGAFQVGPVSQLVTGLTPNVSTTVSFYWGGAQQKGFTGATTDQFQVSLGSQTLFTPVVSLANHGFSGWQHESMTFLPTSSSELLSFIAIGTPNGVPPFALLDGVAVGSPEPGGPTLLAAALAAMGGFVFWRRKAARRQASA